MSVIMISPLIGLVVTKKLLSVRLTNKITMHCLLLLMFIRLCAALPTWVTAFRALFLRGTMGKMLFRLRLRLTPMSLKRLRNILWRIVLLITRVLLSTVFINILLTRQTANLFVNQIARVLLILRLTKTWTVLIALELAVIVPRKIKKNNWNLRAPSLVTLFALAFRSTLLIWINVLTDRRQHMGKIAESLL